jgi:exonuclease SbcD
MLLIHTGDLHLGRTLHEQDLHDEQAAMLDALVALIAERRPEALLLAGDLYDRAIPSPDAIALFDSFLSGAVDAAPGLVVVAIPGNHDSATRLSFGAGLFRRAGVHFRLKASESLEPVLIKSRDGEDSCAVWALPFLGGGADIGDGLVEEGLRGQAELFSAAIERMTPRLRPDSYNLLLAHCFASGGSSSESERAFIGLAEEVDGRLFDRFDYAALGHLHRPQSAGTKGRYPGSPLAYSFGEALDREGRGPERGFLLVELSRGGAATEFVAHRPLHRLRRLEGSFEELSAPGAFADFREDFVEARLSDAEPVLDPAERLKLNFPRLLAVRQAAFEIRLSDGSGGGVDIDTGRDPEDPGRLVKDFALFHQELRGGVAEAETMALVAALAEEAGRASA